jgi:hypothetical protein
MLNGMVIVAVTTVFLNLCKCSLTCRNQHLEQARGALLCGWILQLTTQSPLFIVEVNDAWSFESMNPQVFTA